MAGPDLPDEIIRKTAEKYAEAEQRQTLTRLGFRMEGNLAHVPSWRPDILGEADLVEEVARIASLTGIDWDPARLTAPIYFRPPAVTLPAGSS